MSFATIGSAVPYIPQPKQAMLDPWLEPFRRIPLTRGELTYCLTALVLSQLPPKGERNYAVLSSLRATLQDASDEYYRRVMAPYEDAKCAAYGDVYQEER